MKADAFAMIPRTKENGKEVEIEILPLVLCKNCRFKKDPKSVDGWLPCQSIDTPEGWFCGSGELPEGPEE